MAAVVFAAVSAVSLVRLVVRRHSDDAWHLGMAAGMLAMTMPAADPLPSWAWFLGFGAAAGWCTAVLLRLGPIYGRLGVAIGAAAWRYRAGRAAHRLAANLFMLLTVLVGHRSPVRMPSGEDTVPVHAEHVLAGSVRSVSAVGAIVGLVGLGFLVAAGRSLVRLRRDVAYLQQRCGVLAVLLSPVAAAGCAAVLTAGMAAMALALVMATG